MKQKTTQGNLVIGRTFVVLSMTIVLTVVGFFTGQGLVVEGAEPSPTPPVRRRATQKNTPRPARVDFPHSIHSDKCDECHKFPTANWEKVRTKDAFPDVTDFPRHETCVSCHREQFFSGPRPPICTVCHTNPSPDDSSRFPFPNPRETFDKSPRALDYRSEFTVAFPHAKHVDVVSQNRPARRGFMLMNARYEDPNEQSCAVCHQTLFPQGNSDDEFYSKPPTTIGDGFWLKKGTFKSSPRAHDACFTCHSVDSGIAPAPSDCGSCHKPSVESGAADFDATAARLMTADWPTLDAWQRRQTGKFRHEWMSHAEMSCNSCHRIMELNLLDPKTTKVSISTCDNCHITATSDDGGILNYEIDMRRKDAKFECVKCHVTFGRAPIPESHLKAVGGK